ncbi:low-specificity L-threonine aldolase [Candidatus Poriferisodalis sp.]|uniref:low-specificity L-threonine aldolase n=1 Tax=Candidatus Poriferisodalis sp. TaxID=3101277 RepID=UPI003B51E865
MIDLRSDTVSRPTPGMRAAMAAAEVGDDVWGDDPTVNELERYTAELLGKPAALYVPSGTQSNLCGLLAHCERGDEYIVGHHAHTYMYEGGGAAVLGSIQPQPVPTDETGMVDLAAAEEAVKPDNSHFARTRLLCLENTTDGKVLTPDQHQQARDFADRHSLGLHLDGARLWNAAISLGQSPAEVAAPFDTVSVCLSKGLGAPVGSVLCGSDELVRKARRWRKVLGGGMRQAGIIAAGGLYALQHHIDRLADDHANAQRLAAGLAAIEGITVTGCNTNMVFSQLDRDDSTLAKRVEGRGVLADWRFGRSRMVLHLDVSGADVDTALEVIAAELAA